MKKIICGSIASFLLLATFAHADGPLPVVPAKDQSILLKSDDPRLSANKKLAYDFFRVVLVGLHLDQVPLFMRQDYIQHNPNVDTGMAGFLAEFSQHGSPKEIPAQLPNLVSIQAEGDIVTLSFVDLRNDPKQPGKTYTTTWFDMFRIQDGKIAEHWDCDVR